MEEMPINKWVPAEAESLLDVGCNVGAFLEDISKRNPKTHLAGIDFNRDSVEAARKRLPTAEFHWADAAAIPFPDKSFDVVTCFEVLEHVPPHDRAKVFTEIHRVLRPKGRLVTPHRGWFEFLDSINLRFRFPSLYRLVPRGGGEVHLR
jgi:ubiquinone/menaquinone biosynthesis C-methylase UbiE